MNKVKTLILRTAGTNCDVETAHAFQCAGSEVTSVHINALIKNKTILKDHQILAIPGGFTYGDDIASGKILANELKSNLKNELADFVSCGKLIIGICNGFQVLVKMGFLPDIGGERKIEATLSLNDSGRFDDRWVYLKKAQEPDGKCVWTKDLPEVIYVPIAHAEGKFIPENKNILDRLKNNSQVVFRYSDETGVLAGYPYNPNGSIDDIAGICDSTGRILGMMPHPERHMTYLQHPNWRRMLDKKDSLGIGLKIFENGVTFIKDQL
ncbi:MAG: phosphoribosylformylglycinamidine synthase I [Candidatus Omnitrophota bacterium]